MKLSRFTLILILILTCCSGLTGVAQTLIMNEVSNGPSGNQEYVEFVVVSNTVTYNCSNTTPPCIDIRGWIFDDNSGYHGSAGIASGAVRFSQDPVWACVPLGTIILIYNGADRNPAIPPDDLTMSDGNCTIIAPLNSNLFESNSTTPGASACSYPATGWVSGGNWNNTLLANGGDCARIVNLAGCEVFSLCWGTDNQNNLIYFSGSGGQKVWYFNNGNPSLQANWSSGSASPSPGNQTPGAPNNAANSAYIAQFNNGCMPITQLSVTATATASGCSCNGSATATASGSIGGYTYQWLDASMNPIGQTAATATNLCPGVYYVTATSHIGCTATTSVNIGSSGTLSVTVNSAGVCAGNAAVLQATPSVAGGTFSWTPGGQTTSSVSVSPATTATYAVTYAQGGCSVTAIGTVSVNPLPPVTANSTSVCTGQSATLTANGATTYTWSNGATTQSISVLPSSTTAYTVTGTLAGCTNSAVATVSIVPLPTVSVNNASVCTGQSTTLTATGATTYTWSNGSNGSTISVNPATTANYTVSGTQAGCTNSAVATVSIVPGPTVTVNSSTICAGQSVTLTASGASGYNWSDGSTGTTIMVSPAVTTNYTVTGNASGCSSSAVATVSVMSAIPFSINTATICAGASATLSPAGATSYTWSNGATTSSLVVAPLVTTTYSVTGAVGTCTTTATTTVQVNPLPLVSVNSTTVCAGQSATLTAAGATTYTWSNASTTQSVSVLPATTTNYTVSGTTAGCTNSAVATVSVVSLPTLSVSNTSVCAGQSATLTAAGATTYIWSNGATTQSISILPAATTDYTVNGTMAGCTNSAVATVSVISLPTVSVSNTSVCAGQSATLSAAGATTYTWSNGATTQSISVLPSATTVYTVNGTLAGCTNSAVVTVSVISLPTVSVNNASVCAGQSATLSAAGATTYTWSNGSTTQSISVLPAATTDYTVNGTMAGCTNSAVATVSVVSNPTLTVNSSTICTGQSATLAASGALGYSWSDGSTGSGIIVSPAVTTTYTVTGNTSGCSSSAVATVSVMSAIPVSINAPTICIGASTTLTPLGASSYTWSNGATTNTLVVTPSVTTTYSITGAVGTCTAFATTTVQVNPLPVISVNSSTLCSGQSATLTATGATTYTWSNGSTTQSVSVLPLATTVYTVSGTLAGCTNSAVSNVSVMPTPTISVNSASICSGQSATLIAFGAGTYTWSNGSNTATLSATPVVTSSYTVSGTQASCTGTNIATITVAATPTIAVNSTTICAGKTATLVASGASTYSWNTGATGNTLLVSPATATTYTVTGFNSTCPDTRTVEVVVDQAPHVNFNSDIQEGCAPLCINFADQSSNGSSWLWSFGDGNTSALQNPQHCYTIAGSYNVSLTLTSLNGCSSSTLIPKMITIYPQPKADFSYESGNSQDPVSEVSFTNYSTDANQYHWNFGDSTISSEVNPLHVFQEEGLYEITLVASNDKGCKDIQKVRIEVKGAFTFYAPNTFTPNHDKLNDVFYPVGTGWNPEDYSLRVYDRWGMELFYSNDPAIGWDGKNKGGEVLLIDTYTWKVELQDIYKNRHYYIGHVTLLK